ncbi:hypothetical protein [Hydrocarboniphaga sp.]|uniref:hypothetical protein n=1 Tax=Hydrocarboniphaga sp. TaxID=2033016 RepID=UPI003D09E44E
MVTLCQILRRVCRSFAAAWAMTNADIARMHARECLREAIRFKDRGEYAQAWHAIEAARHLADDADALERRAEAMRK